MAGPDESSPDPSTDASSGRHAGRTRTWWCTRAPTETPDEHPAVTVQGSREGSLPGTCCPAVPSTSGEGEEGSRMRRLSLAAVFSLLALALVAGPVAAGEPDKEYLPSDPFFDFAAGELCAFPVRIAVDINQ